MARIAGRNARLYLAIASNGTAEPIASIKEFDLNGSTNFYDATCYGDTSQVSVAGLPGASGSFKGVFDTSLSGGATVTAAQDGIARKFYFYWDTIGDPTHYFFGTGFWDFSATFPVDGVATAAGNWTAATPLATH